MNVRRNANRLFIFSATLAAIVFQTPQGVAAEMCEAESVTEFGSWFFPAINPVHAGHRTEKVTSGLAGNVVAMRLLIAVTAGKSKDWNLAIRDPSFRLLASFGADDFTGSSGGLSARRWTGHLPGDSLLLDLVAPD